MRISITVTNFSWPATDGLRDRLVEVASIADQAGFDTVFVADHLMQAEPGTDPNEPVLEAFTTLGHLAAHTQRVRLGTMVTAAPWRPPAILIKAVTTLDVLTGGRAWLGIGAGYHQQEATDLGLPLPETPVRFDLVEDTLSLAHQMWAQDLSPFNGKQVTAARPWSSPPPSTRPHPPILIGGTGEKRTLRLVARYGDACNLFDIGDGGAQIRHKLAVLARHCEDLGRDDETIDKTASTRLLPDDTPATFVTRARELSDAGIEHLVVLTVGPWTPSRLAVLGECVEAVAEIDTPTTIGTGALA